MKTLDKHPDTFCTAKPSINREKTLICLKEQKRHFDIGYDMLVGYLMNIKGGQCPVAQLVSTLPLILPQEVTDVMGRTPGKLEETISAAAGKEFGIQGDVVILYNHLMWKRLVEGYERRQRVPEDVNAGSNRVPSVDNNATAPSTALQLQRRPLCPSSKVSIPNIENDPQHGQLQDKTNQATDLSFQSMPNTAETLLKLAMPDLPVGARMFATPSRTSETRSLDVNGFIKHEQLDTMSMFPSTSKIKTERPVPSTIVKCEEQMRDTSRVKR